MADKEKFDFLGDGKDADRKDAVQPPPPKPDGITVKSIETAGVVIDSEGHSWTIPEKDETDVRYKSIFTIPRPDPLMGYQFIRKEELTEYMGDQWVPCTRAEIGVAEFTSEKNEYGDPLDRYHVVGTMICVKKPKVLVDRTHAAQARVCKAAVDATEPPPVKAGDIDSKTGRDMGDVRNGAQYNRGQRRYTLDRKTINARPKNAEAEQVSGTE